MSELNSKYNELTNEVHKNFLFYIPMSILDMDEFKNSTKLGEMEAVVRKAHRTPDITPTVLKALTSHLAFWSTDKRCRSLLD